LGSALFGLKDVSGAPSGRLCLGGACPPGLPRSLPLPQSPGANPATALQAEDQFSSRTKPQATALQAEDQFSSRTKPQATALQAEDQFSSRTKPQATARDWRRSVKPAGRRNFLK